jgi:hypothetical protein
MKRHEPDWTSFVAGATFCVIALTYLGGELTHRSVELRWMIPILLIGLGLAGLAGTLVRARRISAQSQDAPLLTPPDADEPPRGYSEG